MNAPSHPKRLDVVIDTPRFSLIKRKDDGRIDFVSPLPCPFNYGSVPDSRSDDGDRLDAVVLGPRLARGRRVSVAVIALVRFVDAGQSDPKYVCAERPLSAGDRRLLTLFFASYARLKRALNHLRGKSGETLYQGIELL
jgi:inorganic pyrophosphatase